MKRTVLDFGLVSVFAVALAAGCSSTGGTVSSSSGGNSGSSGGSNGSGGSSSSSGGSNGSGGSSSSSGGSNGSGGSSDGSGGSGSGSGGSSGSSCSAVSDMLISDFASAGQLGTPYTGADTGLTKPTAEVKDGALVITVDTGAASTMYPYAFVGMAFPKCIDASAYTGITFKASGTLNSECTIQFSTVDKEHNTVANNGTCTAASCYPSAKIFPLASSPTDVTINFLDQTGGGADSAAPVVTPADVMAIQWQLNVPAAEAGSGCTGTVTIDDVKFTK